MLRAEPTMLLICPKLAAPKAVDGLPRLGWLNALNASNLNWRPILSLIAIRLWRARSKLLYPGPAMIPGPELPKVNCGARRNALVLNHCLIDASRLEWS